MTTGEIRKQVYDWFRTVTGRDVTPKEHKELKAFFVEYGKAANSHNHAPLTVTPPKAPQTTPKIKIVPPKNVDPRSITRTSTHPFGKCKYCNNPAGYGRIICRNCAAKRQLQTNVE